MIATVLAGRGLLRLAMGIALASSLAACVQEPLEELPPPEPVFLEGYGPLEDDGYHLPGGDDERSQLQFETLTFVPFDRRLVAAAMLSPGERDWLNTYHAMVLEKLAPRLSPAALAWCKAACAPI